MKDKKRKIVLAGGSGYLGSRLIAHYRAKAHEIVVLTRGAGSVCDSVRYIHWDSCSPGDWCGELEGADLIINMVGKSVDCRYTEKNRKEIIESRTNATTVLGETINKLEQPPRLWLNAGSAAIYGDTGNSLIDEKSPLGSGFSAEVCKLWEEAFWLADTPRTRKAVLRIGLVFDRDAWVLQPFISMARCGVGGRIGNGNQYVSWIHITDFLQALDMIDDDTGINGAVNIVAPNPVTNREFMSAIRKATGIYYGLPTPAWLLKTGGMLIGKEAGLVLGGRRVVSGILGEKQMNFHFPTIHAAMRQIVRR